MVPTAMVSPLITPTSTLQQLVIDLEQAMMLPWKSYVVVTDDSVETAAVAALVSHVRKAASISVMNIGDAASKSVHFYPFFGHYSRIYINSSSLRP